MILKSRVFIGGGVFTSRQRALEAACEQATAFCGKLPRDSLISVSHSHMTDGGCSVVVWYQTDLPPKDEDALRHHTDADRDRYLDETIQKALQY
jgi:hypothetical protein